MKLPCAVVRDLLPLYAEKMTEQETQSLVDAHLEQCAECRRRLAEIDTDVASPVEAAKPLKAIKKEIQIRRRLFAAVAALLVFVLVYTFFYHDGKIALIPWRDGLIEVEGVQARSYEEVYGQAPDVPEPPLDVLVLKVDSAIGKSEYTFVGEDGTRTTILQGWGPNHSGADPVRDYDELLLYPVPDCLLYSDGSRQRLLWGEQTNGGAEVMPRLSLAYYVVIAAGSALILGAAWFFLRHRKNSRILRQLFLAPLSYLIAHLLIKGVGTQSFFMEREFAAILLLTVALYALLSCAWQLWLRHKG